MTRRAPDSGRSQGRAAWAGAFAIGLFAALVPWLLNRRIYFYNDEETFYYPYYLEIGRQLRHGHWPFLTLGTLCGGNLSIDWQLGLFNPVSLVSYWLLAPAHDLEVASLLFAGFYLVLLALGGYALGRSFGLGRMTSLVVSAVMATNHFVLFFYAGAWLEALVAWEWFIWTWAALQVYRAKGGAGALAGFVAGGYLTITAGWPSTTLLLALLILSYAAELIIAQGMRGPRASRLILGTLSLGFLVMPALLPAFLTIGETGRESGFFNHGFLSPNLGDLLNLSTFFHLPHMRMYNGPSYTPLLYLAWFVAPLAMLFDWKKAIAGWRGRWALGIFAVGATLLLFGPEQLGPLRYPIRFLPGVHAALLLGFFLASQTEGIFRVTPRRIGAAATVIALGLVSSLMGRPEFLALHVGGALLSVLLTGATLYLIRGSARNLDACLLASVLALYLGIHFLYPRNLELGSSRVSPFLSAEANRGRVFDGYSYYLGPNPPAAWTGWQQEFLFASLGLYEGIATINGETTLNPKAFDQKISGSLWGAVDQPGQLAYLFSTDAETGMKILDLMRVNTLILEKNSTAIWAQPFLGGDWTQAEVGTYSIRMERTQPDHRPTTLAWSSPGMAAEPVGAVTGDQESLKITSGAGKGTLVFARLWWPGYSASLEGHAVEVSRLDDLFVKVTLPPAATGLLTLTFVPPGLGLGFALAGLGLLILMLTLRSAAGAVEETMPTTGVRNDAP